MKYLKIKLKFENSIFGISSKISPGHKVVFRIGDNYLNLILNADKYSPNLTKKMLCYRSLILRLNVRALLKGVYRNQSRGGGNMSELQKKFVCPCPPRSS